MPKSPYLNAVFASAYIVALVSAITFGSQFTRDTPDTILAPMAVLSLLVLSASIMCYLFMMRPLALYIDGKKEEAVTFFMRTVGTFAVITLVFLVTAFVTAALKS
jgi:hypothetical protein